MATLRGAAAGQPLFESNLQMIVPGISVSTHDHSVQIPTRG